MSIDTVYQENRALTTETEKLLGRVERLRGYNKGLRAEIERLRRDHMPHMCRMDHQEIRHEESGDDERCPVCIANDEIYRLRERIEELEERDAGVLQMLKDKISSGNISVTEVDIRDKCPGHHITDKQINAAWEKTESLRGSLLALERPDIEKITCNIREELMREFNIFRCEGCGGKGHLDQEPQTGGVYPELEPRCPDCKGKGYTMGTNDDR
jgi:predicted RNase H-like nuclease (RuvC/YqgF family)